MLCLADFEEHAEKVLSKANLGYFKTGSYDNHTVEWNKEAFRR